MKISIKKIEIKNMFLFLKKYCYRHLLTKKKKGNFGMSGDRTQNLLFDKQNAYRLSYFANSILMCTRIIVLRFLCVSTENSHNHKIEVKLKNIQIKIIKNNIILKTLS